MAFSNPKVLILGHSFIRRLEEDINNPKKNTVSYELRPESMCGSLHARIGLEN